MILEGREIQAYGGTYTVTEDKGYYVKATTPEGEERQISTHAILRIADVRIGDFVEITTPSPYGNRTTAGIVTVVYNPLPSNQIVARNLILSDVDDGEEEDEEPVSSLNSPRVTIDGLYEAHMEKCKAITHLRYNEIKNSQQEIHLDSVGAEFESSPEIISKVNKTMKSIINSQTRENSRILELQLKPIKLVNFKKFLSVYAPLAELDKFNYVPGAHYPTASSMHVHVSTYGTSQDLIRRSNWAVLLAPYIFSKKSKKYTFRGGSVLPGGRTTFILRKTDLTCSKRAFVTLNSVVPETTVEYRINENPLPLWVYLIPTLSAMDTTLKPLHTEFTENAIKIKENTENGERATMDSLYTKRTKALCRKALKTALLQEPLVLDYWRGKVKNYPLFEKVMKAYFANSFDSKKTLAYIKGLKCTL
jgi:hypothetical protein